MNSSNNTCNSIFVINGNVHIYMIWIILIFLATHFNWKAKSIEQKKIDQNNKCLLDNVTNLLRI